MAEIESTLPRIRHTAGWVQAVWKFSGHLIVGYGDSPKAAYQDLMGRIAWHIDAIEKWNTQLRSSRHG